MLQLLHFRPFSQMLPELFYLGCLVCFELPLQDCTFMLMVLLFKKGFFLGYLSFSFRVHLFIAC